jgi:hypothetical protein
MSDKERKISHFALSHDVFCDRIHRKSTKIKTTMMTAAALAILPTRTVFEWLLEPAVEVWSTPIEELELVANVTSLPAGLVVTNAIPLVAMIDADVWFENDVGIDVALLEVLPVPLLVVVGTSASSTLQINEPRNMRLERNIRIDDLVKKKERVTGLTSSIEDGQCMALLG